MSSTLFKCSSCGLASDTAEACPKCGTGRAGGTRALLTQVKRAMYRATGFFLVGLGVYIAARAPAAAKRAAITDKTSQRGDDEKD